jgi:phospholipase C
VKLKLYAALSGALVAVTIALVLGLGGASADSSPDADTSTPIKHVVVLFDENESFDHYFGTYPNAANPEGEPAFTAMPGTPTVDGLGSTLLTANPNSLNPQRLTRAQAVTCSQNHSYGPEQRAFDGGIMDKFVQNTAGSGGICTSPLVMDYFDGNTVTGLWNLAQGFALNDNSYSSTFGPSTVGALNLISGQTHGAVPATAAGVENGTVIADPDPSTANDDCASGTVTMTGANVGDLLNAKGVSWGWFQGGFRPSAISGTGKATCGSSHNNVAGGSSKDYSPHHEPFEYYDSTANPHHTAPASPAEIGHGGLANHQYDLTDFDTALANGKLPAVSFLKAAQFEDAHPGNSDPLDEQRFIARTINALEASPDWASTAVVIAYDDSDGWYDHRMAPIVSPSAAPSDALSSAGHCGTVPAGSTAYADRCGYGPRQPLLVISPYARQNFIDHSLTDQTSVLKFIEDNWDLGRIGDQSFDERAGTLESMFDFDAGAVAPKVFLDPTTGVVTKTEAMPGTGVGTPGDGGGTHTTTQTQTVTVVTTTPAPPAPPAVTVTTQAPAPAPVGAAGTPAPATKAPIKAPTLTCTAKSKGAKATVSCTAKGGTTGIRTAVRFRLSRGSQAIATASTTISHNKATATLKAHKSIKKGTYTLTVTVATAGIAARSSHKTVRLG